MTSTDELRPGKLLVRTAALSLVAAVMIAVLGYYPTRTLAGGGGVTAMLVGLAIALAAALVGLVPPLLTCRRPPAQRVSGTLGGMALRFVVALGLLLSLLFLTELNRAALGIWTVIGYMLLLVVDTIVLVRLSERAQRAL